VSSNIRYKIKYKIPKHFLNRKSISGLNKPKTQFFQSPTGNETRWDICNAASVTGLQYYCFALRLYPNKAVVDKLDFFLCFLLFTLQICELKRVSSEIGGNFCMLPMHFELDYLQNLFSLVALIALFGFVLVQPFFSFFHWFLSFYSRLSWLL
jgi:hypothetical protein